MRLERLAVLAACLGLAACATTYTSPASVKLCETLDLEGWKSWSIGGYQLQIDDVQYQVKYDDSQEGLAGKPDDRTAQVYWIEMDGFTSGSKIGRKAPPMMYDPRAARLRLNGRVIRANPEIWTSEFSYGRARPGRVLSGPVDLQRGSTFFVAFPVAAPKPTDQYEVDLGTVSLGGTLKQIPAKKSCYTPQKTWKEPFTLHIS